MLIYTHIIIKLFFVILIYCYPHNIEVNEYSASIPLQELVNHTAKRLLENIILLFC
jgi:hypothetical protein